MRHEFMKAILVEPECDLHRYAFADWLQENGEEALGEFIAVQLQVHQRDTCYCLSQRLHNACSNSYDPLIRRSAELFYSAYSNLYATAPPLFYDLDFRRGFAFRVEVTAYEWERDGPKLLKTQPITELRFRGYRGESSLFSWKNDDNALEWARIRAKDI